MSLKHAILVLLSDQPGSGYDLVQRFRSGIGHFWNATHQQVYQELKKLNADKQVQLEKAQEERPDRKVYRVTAVGRRALKAWLAEPIEPLRIRDALLVKVYGGQFGDRDSLVAELDRHRILHQRHLEEYLQLEAYYFEQDEATRRRHGLPYLTLRRGIVYEKDNIEWLDEVRALIEADRLPAAPVLANGTAGRKPARVSKP